MSTSSLATSAGSPSASEGVQFVGLAVVWGTSFLLIKVAEHSFAPMQVGFGRALVGAVTLALFAAARSQRLPRSPQTWAHLFVAGALLNAVPFALFAYGEEHTSSILAGIWSATSPLFTLPVAIALIRDEHGDRRRVSGLILGFIGVLVVLGAWNGLGKTSVEGNLLCLGAAASFGFGYAYTRRFLSGRPEGSLSLTTAQVGCAALQLAIVTALVTTPPHRVHADAAACIAALGVLGTGVAYVLNYGLIRTFGATNASTVTYLIPIFSTFSGVVLLHETFAANQPLGAAVILLGAATAQGRLGRRRGRPPR
ncbi:DMT family transporter [Baekduia soli]|uniref:DMT family transporter n=1 Tax=Baekduia soli TaxID=496014 RepID=UPI001651B5F3|nr:DMT family transporter [Baekduia soli]